ncbi:MAG: hypothetical protein IH991_06365 [Planctomycetes bacterium]|nr:hypothetical protein [Planctomycetota bacterium]
MTRELPARRIVLLGASNLVRGISTVVETATNVLGSPLDVLAALGHGRSFGMESRVLGRVLPGIIQCGLWDALDQRPQLPTNALITDIGNDILYGASPQAIAHWVEACLVRLRRVSRRIVVTELPLENVLRLGPRRFALIRKLIFPSALISFEDALAAIKTLNDHVKSVSETYGAHVVQPRPCWYGVDPIHIKLRHWPEAWLEVFRSWSDDRSIPLAKGSLRRWMFLRGLRPQQRRLFGRVQTQQQPAGRLPNGAIISYY